MTAKYYDNIVDLPFGSFRQLSVKDNIYALVIEGHPTLEELSKAKASIFSQYNDEMQDGEEKMYWKLSESLVRAEAKLTKFNCCISVLETEITFPDIVVPERRFADALNSYLNTSFPFDHKDPEQFKKDLKRCVNRGKELLLNYQFKKMEFEAVKGRKESKDYKPTDKYYDSILNELSIYVKYEVNDNIKVSRFCDLVHKYNSYKEFLKSQNKK